MSGAVELPAPQILVLNGPNLGRLGRREPEIYGQATYADLVAACTETAAELGVLINVRQTDNEAELIAWLHEASDSGVSVALNAGALTHYSIALRDAAAMVTGLLIEVHLTQIAAREEFRHASVISAVAAGTITGLGIDSYRLALRALAARLG